MLRFILIVVLAFSFALPFCRNSHALAPDLLAEIRALVSLRESGDAAKIAQAKLGFDSLQNEHPTGDVHVFVALNAALCDYSLGNRDQAKVRIEELARKYPQSSMNKLVHAELGLLYRCEWRVAKAEQHLRRAMELNNKSSAKFPEDKLAKIRLEYAMNLVTQGRHDEAYEEFKQLSKLPVVQSVTSLYAHCQSYLATLELRGSQPFQAISRLRSCLERCQQVRPSKMSIVAQHSCHLVLAQIYRDQTRFGDVEAELAIAEKLLKRNAQLVGDTEFTHLSLEIERAHVENTIEEVRTRLEATYSGNFETLMEQVRGAIRQAESTLGKLQTRGLGTSIEAAACQINLCQAFQLAGRIHQRQSNSSSASQSYRQALEHINEALGVIQSLDGSLLMLLENRRQRAHLYQLLNLSDKALAEARSLYQPSIGQYGDQSTAVIELLEMLMDLESQGGNRQTAVSYATQSRKTVNEYLSFHAAGLTPATLQRFFRRWDDPSLHAALRLATESGQYAVESAEWLLNGKAKSAELLGQVSRQMGRGKQRAALLSLIEQQALCLYGSQKGRTEERLLELEAERRKLLESDIRFASSNWYTLGEVQQQLADDEVLIDFFCLRNRNSKRTYYAWLTFPSGNPKVIELGDAEEIDALIDGLVDRMEQFGNPSDAESQLAREQKLKQTYLSPLSKILLHPLWNSIKKERKWIVSPDGALWDVPWSALLIPESELRPDSEPYESYALNKVTFRQVISARDVATRKPAKLIEGEAVVLTNPAYDHKTLPVGLALRPSYERAAPLNSEGAQVFRLLSSLGNAGRIYDQADASKPAILNRSKSPRFLYIDTHGKFIDSPEVRVDDPFLCCFLALAGFNYVPAENSAVRQLPGIMTAAEVLMSNLSGTELVVLSACQSGRGMVAYGHSASSLRHAFHLAGADAVVASTWSVAVNPTATLMTKLIQQISSAPSKRVDKAEALRRAQLEMIFLLRHGELHQFPESGKVYAADPFFWAAFTVSGF